MSRITRRCTFLDKTDGVFEVEIKKRRVVEIISIFVVAKLLVCVVCKVRSVSPVKED